VERPVPAELPPVADEVSWLEEAAPPAPAERAAEEKLFEDEAQFFDLAAELEKELADDTVRAVPLPQPQEQSLEEIVEGFKKGVAENLSAEDYDTHFNLGIAYREMGLLDEAIGEFQLASKAPAYLVECCAMLGVCFLDKGLPELAVKWYRRALESPTLPEEQQLGLLYDLGTALLAAGDYEAGYKAFVDIYGVNSNYRDVVARLEELGRR
jgi:tetratricopeptide (TPR) repeat protein